MITLASLWLPIVLSAVFVFFLSFLLHTVLPWHKGDWKKLAAEDEVMEALRRFPLPAGDYMLPCGGGPEAMKDPKFLEKLKQGPVLLMTVLKSGRMDMGPSPAPARGSHYLAVFRFAGVTAFAAYALAQWQESIWHKRSWGTTMRNNIDGLIYGLVTAGTFGWLWPK